MFVLLYCFVYCVMLQMYLCILHLGYGGDGFGFLKCFGFYGCGGFFMGGMVGLW